jgi:phospholipid/cholesterol/gamma-HCH transport system substrate-binding protein
MSARRRRGADPVRVALALIVLLVVGIFFAFTKRVPLHHGFRVQAVFRSANEIRPNSPVRIAGVAIGHVTRVSRYAGGDGNAALVTMEIDRQGLPIHKDATAKIRPRTFLEGNFFVDLHPGTPSAPSLGSGDTLPITQTAAPVQLDQVLTALQSDTRTQLQRLLEGYSAALTARPTVAQDATQDRRVRGRTAAQTLHTTIGTGGPALKGTAIVGRALLGRRPHDLSRLIADTGKVTAALSRNDTTLQELIVNFDTTMGTLAAGQDDLRTSVQRLAPTLATARRALALVDAALPDTRAIARELVPGVRAVPATITAADPWIAQARRLVGADELGGLVTDLRPATRRLAAVATSGHRALPQADRAAQCLTKVVLPTGNVQIQDGPFTSGLPNYQEFWQSLVGLAGEGAGFDGNGHVVRLGLGGGDQTWATGIYAGTSQKEYARTNLPPLGTRPAYPGAKGRTPYTPSAPCRSQARPDVNGAATGPADGQGPGGTPASPQPQAVGDFGALSATGAVTP